MCLTRSSHNGGPFIKYSNITVINLNINILLINWILSIGIFNGF